MNIVRVLFFIPPFLYSTYAAAQNFPVTNSAGGPEGYRTGPTETELDNPVAIPYGRNSGREIPPHMALYSFSMSALRAFDSAERRASWYRAYDLDQSKEEALKSTINEFLADYEGLGNARRQKSCETYYQLKAQGRDGAAKDNAYALLKEEYTGADSLYASTINAIRANVSDLMADVFEDAVQQRIETSSMAVHDDEAFNARHGVTPEEFFGKTCK